MTFEEPFRQPKPHYADKEGDAAGGRGVLGLKVTHREPGARTPTPTHPPTSLPAGHREACGELEGGFLPPSRFHRPLPQPGANRAGRLGRAGCSRSAARSSMARGPGEPGWKLESRVRGGADGTASGSWKPKRPAGGGGAVCEHWEETGSGAGSASAACAAGKGLAQPAAGPRG